MVSCHLGNGSSLAAVKGGRCVDTSMGLTPLAGLPMGTRAGDMDVGVVEFIANKYDMTISEAVNLLNKESGMLGLSGVSSDFRDLEQAAEKENHRATVALEIFEYRVRKMIAEYAAAMGGVDVVVFTAGVGENAPETRAHPPRSGVHGHHLRPGEEQLPGQGADHLPGRRARHRHGDPHQRGADDRPGHHGAGPGSGVIASNISKGRPSGRPFEQLVKNPF